MHRSHRRPDPPTGAPRRRVRPRRAATGAGLLAALVTTAVLAAATGCASRRDIAVSPTTTTTVDGGDTPVTLGDAGSPEPTDPLPGETTTTAAPTTTIDPKLLEQLVALAKAQQAHASATTVPAADVAKVLTLLVALQKTLADAAARGASTTTVPGSGATTTTAPGGTTPTTVDPNQPQLHTVVANAVVHRGDTLQVLAFTDAGEAGWTGQHLAVCTATVELLVNGSWTTAGWPANACGGGSGTVGTMPLIATWLVPGTATPGTYRTCPTAPPGAPGTPPCAFFGIAA